MTRLPTPLPRVVSIRMADGSDPSSPEARARIARALTSTPTPTAPPARDEQPRAG